MEAVPHPADRTPDALLAGFRAEGRPGDLADLFDATAPELFRLALHLCPDAATAEDCLQQTFVVVLERAEAWDPGRPALPWLTGILKHEAQMARRRAARRPDPRRLDAPPPDDPALAAESGEESERLRAAMRRLPEPYRGVALLRWRYGLEPAEIAEVKGVPPGTVWSWLHRALQRLKSEVGAMPALLLAFRGERGIDGVRAALLRHAAARAAAVAASSSVATTMGGFLMANKAIAAGAAAVLLAGAGWLAFRGDPPPTAAPTAPEVAAAPAIRPTEPPPPMPPAPTDAAPAEPPLPAPVDLSKCDRDLDLFGEVVDGKGDPVPGAEVRTRSHPWRETAPLSVDRRDDEVAGPLTRTARDGTFVLRLRRGQSVDLLVKHAGFRPAQVARRLAGERVRVVMAEGARLEVAVKDADGAPVRGAEARLWRNAPVLGTDFQARLLSDESGRCAFEGLPPGRMLLAVEHAEHGVPEWQHQQIAEGGVATAEVVFPRGRTIGGTVTDARTGKPIAGARVGGGWVLHRTATTDAEGKYAWRDWTGKGFDDLHCTAEGYGRQGQVVPPEGPVDFTLQPGDRIVGRIVGADGSPVAAARIGCVGYRRASPTDEIDTASVVTGGDGRFEIASLRHDLPHLLVIAAPGHGRGLFDVYPPPESPGRMDLGDVVLAEARAIEGRVLDASGDPLPGIAVALSGSGTGRTRYLPAGFRPLDVDYGVKVACRADDLGRFRFPDLAPGDYRLTARDEGAVIAVDFPVVLGPDRDVLDVVLRPAEAGGQSLTVLLLDDAGSPVPGLKVRGVVGREMVTKDSGPDGRAKFESLAAEQVHLSVFEFPFDAPRRFVWPKPELVKPAGQEVVLRLRRAGEIRGVVLAPDRTPLGGISVMARDAAGDWGAGAFAKEDGTFAIPVGLGDTVDLSINGQRLKARTSGRMDEASPYRGERKGVVCPAEGVEIVTTIVESNRRITVRVLDLQGNPMARVPLTILKPGERMFPSTGEDGRLTVEGLLAEEIQVSALMPAVVIGGPPPLPDGTVLPEPVKVVPDGQEITLRLRTGVPITGTVLDSEGRPTSGARVDLQTTDFVGASALTGADGRFKTWISPNLKLRHANVYTFLPEGRGIHEHVQLDEAALAAMGDALVFRLKPYDPPR